jgi:pyruvate formate-lyase activating enzyme-like uncharacterized protein
VEAKGEFMGYDCLRCGAIIDSYSALKNHDCVVHSAKEGISKALFANEKQETVRGQILDTAKNLTESARNQTYGDPVANMKKLGELIGAYLGVPVSAVQASVICVLLKVSRVAVNEKHADNYLDLAAYAAIAGECAGVEVPRAVNMDSNPIKFVEE